MIQDWFNSFKGNFNQKTTNPFFGTLLMVWVYKNWVLIYAIFNFDDSYTLENKINFITNHINYNILLDIAVTFAILSFSYLLINISRLIVNFFEKKITPLIYKLTDKNSIVLKSEYDRIININIKIKEQYESERTNRIKAEDERDRFEKILLQSRNLTPLENNYSDIEVEKFKNIVDRLHKEGILEHFEIIIEDIGNGKPSIENKELNFLLKIGLISKGEWLPGQGQKYMFTMYGEKFKNYYVEKFILQKGLEILPHVVH